MRSTRVLTEVNADDLLWCYLGGHTAEAINFVRRGPNTAEPNRTPSYRAYCKECHRSRNGASASPRRAGNGVRRATLVRDAEVEHALGVLRDARGRARGKQGYVYLIIEDIPGGALYYGKVGYSTNPEARVAELQTGNPRVLRLHAAKPGTEADERRLHAKYTKNNVLQEWFHITKELLLEWDVEHIVKKPAPLAQAA